MSDSTALEPLAQSVKTTQTVQRKVRIRVVEEVSDLDYPQAKRAWEALEAAGVAPGKMIATALQEGHGYKVVEVNLNESIADKKDADLIGESAASEDTLVGYQYVLESPPSEQALVRSSQSVVLGSDLSDESIDMTGIKRRKMMQLSDDQDR